MAIGIRFCISLKRSIFALPENGPVAQGLEHRTHNPRVAGSIPARPTERTMLIHSACPFFYLLKLRALLAKGPWPVTRIETSNPPLPLLAGRSVDVFTS